MEPPPALLSFWAQGQGQCPPVLAVRRGWVIGSSQRSMKMNRSAICHKQPAVVCTRFFSSSPAVTEAIPSLVPGPD